MWDNIPSLMKYVRRIPAEKCWDDVSQGVVPSNVEIFNKWILLLWEI